MTLLGGSAGNASSDVVLPAVAEVASSADCVGGVASRPTVLRCFPWPLLSGVLG